MPKGFIFYIEYFHQEIEAVVLTDLENVSSDQLFHQVFSQLWSNL